MPRSVASDLVLPGPEVIKLFHAQLRLLFFNASIKAHFDYCSIVWVNSSNNNINKINKLQRRACKFILGKEYTNLEEARNRLKILSFEESVFLQKAKTMYKIANKIAPKYLIDLFQIRNTNANDTICIQQKFYYTKTKH